MDVDVTEKEAFRLGFLARCAEEGLTGEQLQARIKTAAEKEAVLGYVAPAMLGVGLLGASYLAPELTGKVVGLPIAGGLALGGGLGYAAAKMTEPNISEEDIKQQELSETYRAYAERAKAKRKAYKYLQNRMS